MKVLRTVFEVKEYCFLKKREGFSIGLVPTMGALHEGHLSLVYESKKNTQCTIATIFVNPIQFNNSTDLEKYPRTLEKDIEMLESAQCDAVFCPDEKEMYFSPPQVKMTFGPLEHYMEGAFRPGHFSGVGVVVAKLFNIVQPDHAFFGQKDLQQFLVIHQLVKDLSFPIQLHCCPILREEDGLAMSSRNRRLSSQNRALASKVYEGLQLAKETLKQHNCIETKEKIAVFFSTYKELTVEYFEISDGETLAPVEDVAAHSKIALCIAVYLDGVRLIDNLLIE